MTQECGHTYGVGPGYEEEGYYRLMTGPFIDGRPKESELYDEFDYCPGCGVKLTKEE